MSHFTVLVLTDGGKSVTDLLGPYDESGEWFRGKKGKRPASRWDWWVVGGRWTGLFSDYDPNTDIKNWSICNYCGGTGSRPGLDVLPPQHGYKIVKTTPERAADIVAKRGPLLGDYVPYYMAVNTCLSAEAFKKGWHGEPKAAWESYDKGCNACYGSGADRSFHNREVKGVNTLPVATILEKYADDAHRTHAIVTPDGEWHEESEMGWFGISRTDKKRDWPTAWIKILKAHKKCTATLVDCHV
jgi:hypothetical protein